MARKFLTNIDLTKLELLNAAFQSLATPPDSPTLGQYYYDTSITPKQLKVYNGSSWETVGKSQEEIEDFVNGLIVAGSGIAKNYNDGAGTLTISNTGVLSLTGTANEVNVSASAGNVIVGLPDDVTITNNLSIGGNLSVSGSVTYINTETLEVADNLIVLNSNVSASAVPIENAGIEINRGASADVSILWNESSDLWTLTNDGTNYHQITRKFSTSVGNSASTQFTITHNLGTRDVQVQIYDNATYDTIETDVVRTSANAVQITFAVAPATDAYRVVVVG